MLVECARCKKPVAPNTRCASCGYEPPTNTVSGVLRVAGIVLVTMGLFYASRHGRRGEVTLLPGVTLAGIGVVLLVASYLLRR